MSTVDTGAPDLDVAHVRYHVRYAWSAFQKNVASHGRRSG
jgi:hypothetical protein